MAYYPKSFLKLILFGLILVMLPLGYAFYYAAKSLDRLANQSQRAVYEAVQVTQAAKGLRERITDMERIARQYLILEENSLIEGYRKIHGQFREVADKLATSPIEPEQRTQLEQLMTREARVFDVLAGGGGNVPNVKRLIGEYEELDKLAKSLSAESNSLIERQVDAMRDTTARAQELIFWQAIALIPLAIVGAIGVTIVITRPFGQINDAIRLMGDGELTSAVKVSGPHDLVNLGKRLDWLRRRLLELEQQKSKFLQRVSHELKTPLTALREGSELLADQVGGKLTDQQLEIVGILRHKSMQLQKLIENLLNYSAVEFHKTAPRLEPIAVQPVLEKVASEHKLALRTRGLRLRIIGAPITVEADPEMLRVVVDNLLSNAIKFSPHGGAIIIKQSAQAGQAIIEVADQGPGIADNDIDRIFDPFYEGQAPADSHVKGSGLGLAISRDYVRAHNGHIEVVRGGAQGAQFRITLPLQHTAAAA